MDENRDRLDNNNVESKDEGVDKVEYRNRLCWPVISNIQVPMDPSDPRCLRTHLRCVFCAAAP